MKREEFEILKGGKEEENKGDSYLIYDLKDISNTKIIEHNNFEVNEKYIFLGLNFSKPVDNFPKYFNFHCKYLGCSDIKIMKFFFDEHGDIFKGSYMTDAIANFPMLRAVDAYKAIVNDKNKIEENKERLNKLMIILPNAKLLCFGPDTYNLCLNIYKLDSHKLVLLNHYSSWGKFEDLKKKWKEQLRINI